MDMEPEEKRIVVNLEGEWIIQRAKEWKDFLLAQLSPGNVVEFDIRGVRAIDITGLQLLCSAHRTARQGGGDIRIISEIPVDVACNLEAAGFVRVKGCKSNCDHPCLWAPGERK